MPTKLGRYEIQGELGSGAMGIVYRAEDPRLGRPVALKTTNAEVAGNPDLLKRFYREAQAAAKLTHPNIVTIYEIDEANGVPFIAMEFLEGASIQKVIADRSDIPILKKVQIVIDTCKGLDYAHQHGIVHRDVKPGNIVVLNNGQVKIVDFGIARVGVSSMTRTGVVLGTVMYMSPEQVQGQTVDARSDVFSLGVVLYELLTYQTPFPGDDVPSILYKILNEPPEAITKCIPQCPAPLEQIVQRALAKDREERYQSAEDMAFDLQRIADNLKRDTVDVFLQQGQRCLQQDDLTIAKESLQKVLEIDSSHELAKSLLAQVRERIQSRQRMQKVEHDLGQAKEALQAEQYEDAVSLLEEVLCLDSGNEEAKQCKQLAVERRDRSEKIRRHLERAGKLAAQADFQRAKADLEAVLAIEPGSWAALGMMRWVIQELSEQGAASPGRTISRRGTCSFGCKKFRQGSRSLGSCPRTRRLQRRNRGTDKVGPQQRGKGRATQAAGQARSRNRGNPWQGKTRPSASLRGAELREFPDDAQVLRLHEQVLRRTEVDKKRRLEEQLRAARDFVHKNEHSSALAVLERAIQTVPDDPRLGSFIKTVQESQEQIARETSRQDAIREANEQIRAQNFPAAIDTLEKSLARAGQSPDLIDLLQLARERYAEQQRQERIRRALARAQSHLREQEHEQAIQVLTHAQNELESNEIDALLTTAREQRQAFEQRREEIVAKALELLESGEAARAVALFEAAPKASFRKEDFQRVYSQCRQSLDRANFVHSVVQQAEKSLAEEDLGSAHAVLEQALKVYPNDASLRAVDKRIQEEELRLRREQRVKLLEEAQVALGRMEYAVAAKLLTSVSVGLR